MNDPQRKPPGKPDIPTLRPKALRGDDPDLPAPPRVPGQSADEDPRTQALDVGDLEELDALLDEAEQDLSDVSSFEQKSEPKEVLQSGRPPEEPPRKLPTIGMFGPYHIVGRLALGGMAVGRVLSRMVDRPTAFYPIWFYGLVETVAAGALVVVAAT